MKERPILFSAPMVRAILDGSKTQTRRVWKMPRGCSWYEGHGGEPAGMVQDDEGPAWWHVEEQLCPYGKPGDRLWVRETFSGPWCMEAQDGIAAAPPSKWGESSKIWYWADGDPTYGDWTRPRPSIHMPRWASRILLEIVSVRVERLQDISEDDAQAEGIEYSERFEGYCIGLAEHFNSHDPRQSYFSLWEAINGAGSVAANPWVWVVEFRRVEMTEGA